jgi:hypothetical protein
VASAGWNSTCIRNSGVAFLPVPLRFIPLSVDFIVLDNPDGLINKAKPCQPTTPYAEPTSTTPDLPDASISAATTRLRLKEAFPAASLGTYSANSGRASGLAPALQGKCFRHLVRARSCISDIVPGQGSCNSTYVAGDTSPHPSRHFIFSSYRSRSSLPFYHLFNLGKSLRLKANWLA